MPFHFDFTVTGLTREQADALLDFINQEVTYYGAELGGGLAEVSENGDALTGEPANDTPRAE